MNVQEALHDLFLVDQQVRGLESRLTAATRRVKAQEARLSKLSTQRADLLARFKHEQAQAGNIENETDSLEDRVGHLREQMNTAKTNKEYSALLVEINTLKAEKGKLEEEALSHLGAADDYKAQIDALDAEIAEVQTIKAAADEELASRMAEVGDALERVKAERDEAAKKISPELLSIFNRLTESNDGEPLAVVEETDRRRMEYICGGCYMQLPVEKLNILLTSDNPVRCTSCGRFLYLDKELRASFA